MSNDIHLYRLLIHSVDVHILVVAFVLQTSQVAYINKQSFYLSLVKRWK